MSIVKTLLRLVLVSVVLTAGQAAPSHLRTVKVRANATEPEYTLLISAKEADGIVEVRDASGAKVQTLTCSLDVPPFAPGLDDARREAQSFLGQLFVENLVAGDLNFDGYADLKATREYAMKFQNYCVWLYHPQSHTFVRDALAEQMEQLSNLEADPRRQRVTQGVMIGNFGFSLAEYKIDRASEPLGEQRLVPVQSCQFSNFSKLETTYTLTNYAQGQPAATRTQKGQRSQCELPGEGLCDCIRSLFDAKQQPAAH